MTIDNIKDNYIKYRIKIETDKNNFQVPQYIIQPAKNDKIYFYIENEIKNNKDSWDFYLN